MDADCDRVETPEGVRYELDTERTPIEANIMRLVGAGMCKVD